MTTPFIHHYSARFRPSPRVASRLATALVAVGLLAVPATVAANPASAATAAPVAAASPERPLNGQTPTVGWFRGQHVRYLDEGLIQLAKDASGNFVSDVDPIWVVANGTAAQRNIIDNVPGLNSPDDYTPLWQIVKVTWAKGATPFTLTSAADVVAAQTAGDVTVTKTDSVVNCPVLGFDQKVTTGWFRHHAIRYLDEGTVTLATGPDGSYLSDVDPIWVVTNGATAQRNVIDNVPNLNKPDDYTPLWQVVTVTWATGLRPLTLTSRIDVLRAQRNGWVTLHTTSTVVNCPVL